MLNEYRERFGEYWSEIHRADYQLRSGRNARRSKSQLSSDFSDLFSRSSVDELRAKLSETSELRETEKTSLKRLIAFALEGCLELQGSELEREIDLAEERAAIDWEDSKIGLQRAAELLSVEPDPGRRRELWARFSDQVKRTQDLRAEQSEKLLAGARELGYESYLEFRSKLREVDDEKLLAQTAKVLTKTESAYVGALSFWLSGRAGVSIDEAVQADLGYLQRQDHFDHFFSRERAVEIYRDFCAGLGFKIDRQDNLEIDLAARAGKQAQPFCAPVRVPDEIKLAGQLIGGEQNYRDLFRAAGAAQSYAWTSRNLYPEFRVNGDGGLVKAWGMLCESLFRDEHWLMGVFGFAESGRFRRALDLFRLIAIRRQAGKFSYEVEFYADRLGQSPGARYSELLSEAVRVRFDETTHLIDLSPNLDSAGYLRASAFEAQLREHLKSRYGVRWWTSPRAGDMLIDLWNTGQRYTLEEMASMIGLGELDFEWLAAELVQRIQIR